jgi:hypothetical protein
MIPTLLLLGLILGPWWRVVVPAAAVGWPAFLIATNVDRGLGFAVSAGSLAVANVAIGVLLNRWLARLSRAAERT